MQKLAKYNQNRQISANIVAHYVKVVNWKILYFLYWCSKDRIEKVFFGLHRFCTQFYLLLVPIQTKGKVDNKLLLLCSLDAKLWFGTHSPKIITRLDLTSKPKKFLLKDPDWPITSKHLTLASQIRMITYFKMWTFLIMRCCYLIHWCRTRTIY